MTRTIKFRVVDKHSKKIIGDFTLLELCNEPGEYDERDVEFYQFTGLLDKNGKEIYCGDIVKTDNNSPKEVRFIADAFTVSLSPFGEAFFGEGIFNYAQCEIIGNIYENPELLTS